MNDQHNIAAAAITQLVDGGAGCAILLWVLFRPCSLPRVMLVAPHIIAPSKCLDIILQIQFLRFVQYLLICILLHAQV